MYKQWYQQTQACNQKKWIKKTHRAKIIKIAEVKLKKLISFIIFFCKKIISCFGVQSQKSDNNS